MEKKGPWFHYKHDCGAEAILEISHPDSLSDAFLCPECGKIFSIGPPHHGEPITEEDAARWAKSHNQKRLLERLRPPIKIIVFWEGEKPPS
jgi:hypothetical protein